MRSSRLSFKQPTRCRTRITTDMRRKTAIGAPGMWLRAA